MPISKELIDDISLNYYKEELLQLADTDLTPEDIKLLSEALQATHHIKRADLSYNEIGDEGAKLLASLELNELTLIEAGLGREGAAALSNSNITILNLAANPKIGAQSGGLCFLNTKHIRELSLDECGISNQEARAVLKNLNLEKVSLSSNSFTNDALAELPQNSKIRTLVLSQNEITKEGAEFIAKNLLKLEELDLSSNAIGDSGAAAFAIHPTVETLDLSGNGIGKEGFLKLCSNKKIKKLSLLFNKIAFDNIDEFLPQAKTLH